MRIFRSPAATISAAILAIAGMLAALPALADFPRATLAALQPTGGKQGSQVTVTLLGADLDDLEKLIFSHPGISATPEMTAPTTGTGLTPRVPGTAPTMGGRGMVCCFSAVT
jgi:hypothetical protein